MDIAAVDIRILCRLFQQWCREMGKTIANGLTTLPPWCAETHVYHLNGTVEQLPNNSNRSQFVLESDPPTARIRTIEGEIAFNKFIWNGTFVVVGMSFECEVDKYLLKSLRVVQDDLPIGESSWYIVNPDKVVLASSAGRIRAACLMQE
jgi:hypothetical protein